ncbi:MULTISPECIES: DUF4435 domain-containing protein [Streptomyces]|uniref:DUF4435 domain-containing protein n=1 Tax=Streptomyces TaxID=1883 RepID=UPI002242E2B2|nr:DUF4435 domain-containing protein [Streptomyces griseolus]MCW8220084.1 hypothetical protein [Streptomyces griseolus]
MENPLSLRSYEDLPARIRLHRQGDARPIVIVEGPTDEGFLKDAFGDGWVYFSAAGRPNALSAICEVVHQGTQSVFCVVDRDFDDEISSPQYARMPIITYRNADLEAMIANEDTLAVTLRSFGRAGVDSLDLATVLDEIAKVTQPISLLRRSSYVNGWGLNFDGTEPADKIDQRRLELNIVGYCQALINVSNNPPALPVLLEVATGQRPSSLPSCPHGATYYFNGKDFAAILGVFLRKKLGTLSKSQSERKHICAILRSAAAGRLRRDEWALNLEKLVNPSSF